MSSCVDHKINRKNTFKKIGSEIAAESKLQRVFLINFLKNIGLFSILLFSILQMLNILCNP